MSTCHYVYPPIDLSTLHMHSCPDCEAANMSQFSTNLSRLRHHSAAGAPGGDTVSPCSHSTSYVSLQEDCVSNVGHIRESKCPISQQRDRESSVSWGTGFQTERACPQTAQASTLPHHRSSVQIMSTKSMGIGDIISSTLKSRQTSIKGRPSVSKLK